jgi:hypothetical protein
MFRKLWSLVALAAVGTLVFANVDLRTNIQDIYYRGTCEEAGSITMSVNGDDFADATTQTPVFIRIRLDKGAKLCQTLVDFVGTDAFGNPHVNNPIWLAMRLEGNQNQTIIAPPETVSLCRWIRSEDALWLKIQSSSSQWINDVAGPVPPDINRRVAWTFGTTARTSWITNNPRYPVTANLPCNTRNYLWTQWFDLGNPGAWATTELATTTLLCVNVSQSILTPMPQLNSELNFDTISFLDDFYVAYPGAVDSLHVETAPNAASIENDNQYTANFSGDDTIARGFDVVCTISTYKPPAYGAKLCFIDGGNAADTCLTSIANSIEIDINCAYGLNGGSFFAVSTPAGSPYWFRVRTVGGQPVVVGMSNGVELFQVLGFGASVYMANNLQASAWVAYTPATYVSVYHGFYRTSLVFVELGEMYDFAPNALSVVLSGTVYEWCEDPASSVYLDVELWLTNHGDPNDVTPFDEILTSYTQYQDRYCPPSAIMVGEFEWFFGVFYDCFSDITRIFFPYLPMIANNDTFWAGLSFVNQGYTSFDAEETFAWFYEADGAEWYALFPALPVRTQQTYLLDDGEQGVGFYNDVFVPLDPYGNDLVPLDKRSSMFVLAQHVGTTAGALSRGCDICYPDLDGFLMIGNEQTGDVYGYLPRNEESINLGQDWQDGDLPEVYPFKRSAVSTERGEKLQFDAMVPMSKTEIDGYKRIVR